MLVAKFFALHPEVTDKRLGWLDNFSCKKIM
jgi:hypothetical protein